MQKNGWGSLQLLRLPGLSQDGVSTALQWAGPADNQGFRPSRFGLDNARGNLAHSCLAKSSITFAGALPERVGPGLATIHPHAVHPQAAKVLSSRQVSSLGMDDFIHKTRPTQYPMGLVEIGPRVEMPPGGWGVPISSTFPSRAG